MPDLATDPYTVRAGEAQPAPPRFLARLRHLGPSVIVSGSVVGSGEIILTSSLGAAAGFALLWWVLVSCWSKSLVQAQLARYVIVTGDTDPGRLREAVENGHALAHKPIRPVMLYRLIAAELGIAPEPAKAYPV